MELDSDRNEMQMQTIQWNANANYTIELENFEKVMEWNANYMITFNYLSVPFVTFSQAHAQRLS